MIAYKRPPALRDCLTNYKKIACDQHATAEDCSSVPCRHCALRGNHHSMVEKEDYLCTPTGRIKLTQRLYLCKLWDLRDHLFALQQTIYVYIYIYIGQTNNKFSVRWTIDRNNWHKSTEKEEGGLIKHYTMKHPAISDNLPLLPNCYKLL